MRFLLDENEIPALLDPLRFLHPMHQFDYSPHVFGAGVLDLDLFRLMREHGYDALITRDANQLDDPAERRALYEHGIHWIGHRPPKARGVHMVSALSAAYVAAFPHILGALTNEQDAVAIHVSNLPQSASTWVKKRPITF